MTKPVAYVGLILVAVLAMAGSAAGQSTQTVEDPDDPAHPSGSAHFEGKVLHVTPARDELYKRQHKNDQPVVVEFHPDMDFLSKFAKAPITGRLKSYDRIDLMTDRDLADLPKGDIDTFVCLRAAKMIDIQRMYEKIGSHGVYSMDALLESGPKACRPFLVDMANAPL